MLFEIVDKKVKLDPSLEYMCEAHEAYFQQKLLDMKKEIEEFATSIFDENASIRSSDESDIATNLEMAGINNAQSEKRTENLRNIALALERIGSGDFGFCKNSGAPIGLARLDANPCAEYTIDVQNQIELRKKQFAPR